MQLSTEIGEIISTTAEELTTVSSDSGPFSFKVIDKILIFIFYDRTATAEYTVIFLIIFFYRTKDNMITNRITIIPVQIYLNLEIIWIRKSESIWQLIHLGYLSRLAE